MDTCYYSINYAVRGNGEDPTLVDASRNEMSTASTESRNWIAAEDTRARRGHVNDFIPPSGSRRR